MALIDPAKLPDVYFSDEGPIRHLHLESIWIQGSMNLDAPLELVHQYTQRMMAWLLFVEPDSVAKRRAMQLGLGAGSLTKFCSKVPPEATVKLFKLIPPEVFRNFSFAPLSTVTGPAVGKAPAAPTSSVPPLTVVAPL